MLPVKLGKPISALLATVLIDMFVAKKVRIIIPVLQNVCPAKITVERT
jgi:hypothetical protein